MKIRKSKDKPQTFEYYFEKNIISNSY